MLNPLAIYGLIFTRKLHSFTRHDRTITRNCKTVRQVIHTYVQKRIDGEIKGQLSDKTDLLSQFLTEPDVFTTEVIIDELVDFFLAATQTTQYATQTIMSYFSKNPDGVNKVRKELEQSISQQIKEDESLKNLGKAELLQKTVHMETCQDQDFLSLVT